MEKTPFAPDDFNGTISSNTGIKIDYRRVLFRALQYWYVIAASIFTCLVVAFLLNRYTTRIYPITASILIRESGENPDAQFIYNNPLVNANRNFFNELYIIKSYPLVQSVIESLNFQVSIQKEGNIKATEQYSIPIEVQVNGFNFAGSFSIEIISEDKFKCISGSGSAIYSFGDQVNCEGQLVKFSKTSNISHLIGERYLVTVHNPQSLASQYINKLTVGWAQQGSSVVNLEISGSIPKKEIDFLNQLIVAYQKYDLDKKNQAASRSLSFIDDQLKEIGDSLQLFENALENFKKNNFIVEFSTEAQQLYNELKLVNEQKSGVVFAVNYYNYLDEYLTRKNDYAKVILPSSIGVTDEVLNEMVNHLVALQTELNLLPQPKEVENPLINERSGSLTRAISDSKAQIIESVRTLRETDKIKIAGLTGQIKRISDRLSTLPGIQRKLVNIQRNYTFSENMYNFLLQKKAEAGISKASNTTDIVVVNPPRQSGGQITPKIFQNYIFGVVGGTLIPVLLFLLAELLNTRIQSKEDIENATSIPLIGGIGHNSEKYPLVVLSKPRSSITESFRALRSNLSYFTSNKEKQIFMVTSSIPGEGKSFTTLNLASVFALAGKRTIVVGADLRKPKLFKELNLSNEKGLSQYLSGMATLDEIIQKAEADNLFLIPGGAMPPNPSELLLKPLMSELIAKLKEHYDFIILDTPPLGLITDAFMLAQYADHTLFVVRQNYTPRQVLRSLDEYYTTNKLPKVSIVFNDVRKTGLGYGYNYDYGYYNYGYGYGYGMKKKSKQQSEYFDE